MNAINGALTSGASMRVLGGVNRLRRSFGKISEVADLPTLIEIGATHTPTWEACDLRPNTFLTAARLMEAAAAVRSLARQRLPSPASARLRPGPWPLSGPGR